MTTGSIPREYYPKLFKKHKNKQTKTKWKMTKGTKPTEEEFGNAKEY